MTSTVNNYYEEGPPISCGLVYIIIIAGLQCNYVNKESGDDTVAEVAHVHVRMRKHAQKVQPISHYLCG